MMIVLPQQGCLGPARRALALMTLGLWALAACAPTLLEGGSGAGPAMGAPLNPMQVPSMSNGQRSILSPDAAGLQVQSAMTPGDSQNPGAEIAAATAAALSPNTGAAPAPARSSASALPSSDPTLASYARSTSNAVGKSIYSRPGNVSHNQFLQACARYPDQDAAQEAFLNAGGPQSDPIGLDPDGDGFACYWDPAQFRQAHLSRAPAPIAREVLPSAPAKPNGG